MLTPTMSLEAGAHYYGDGSKGPSLEWTRWFGDVSVQLFYRKGGNNQFAGLQMSLPLTPRQGMAPGSVFVTGASQYAQSVRTRLTTSSSPANLVIPGCRAPPPRLTAALTSSFERRAGFTPLYDRRSVANARSFLSFRQKCIAVLTLRV
jgi:hypothetical protein